MTYTQALKKAHKELQNKTGQEQVEFCKEKTGNDWEKIDDRYKYGLFIKKEIYSKEIKSNYPNYDGLETVTRSRLITITKKLTEFNEDNINFVMAKHLDLGN